ncbi:MAG: hypothetical protein QOH76_1311, partial [Thermoleophilaceae bacterium]|nr:hypothetical protein [Thermoleophilaceae bacterium]
MNRKLLYLMVVATLALAAVVAFALPAGAAQRTFRVQLTDGSIITVTVDAACVGVPSGLPGTPVGELPGACAATGVTPPTTPTTTPTTPGKPPPSGGGGHGGKDPGPTTNGGKGNGGKPSSGHGHSQTGSGSKDPAGQSSSSNPQGRGQGTGTPGGGGGGGTTGPTHHSNGVPTSNNPTFFDALPGPSAINGVPNFVIQKFKVPIFLLPIYQAAGIQYGVRWEVLAAINEIETDYGRNLNVSSAGALGWMQFMPATWKMYGVDANQDGKRDPYNPVDAIFAAARYLKAAGAQTDLRKAIFAYNHAGWYV